MPRLKLVIAAALVSVATAATAIELDKRSVKARTMPTGKVLKEGDPQPTAQQAAAEEKVAAIETAAGEIDGQATYDAKCSTCHGGGIAGAPKAGDKAAWADRVTKGEEALFSSAINGFQGKTGFMPAKGGCFDCSDDQIKAAVQHMLELVK